MFWFIWIIWIMFLRLAKLLRTPLLCDQMWTTCIAALNRKENLDTQSEREEYGLGRKGEREGRRAGRRNLEILINKTGSPSKNIYPQKVIRLMIMITKDRWQMYHQMSY